MTAEAPSITDEELALRAQRGDRPAFEILIRRHKNAVYRLVRRYLGEADDAYDIVQDTLISVWEALHRYDSSRPFLAWLRVIALNKCRDFSRRRAFRRLILRTFASERSGEPVTPAEDARARQLSDDERLRRLDQAVAALPALYKEPLLLTTVSGLSHEATAAVLNTTAKAVEMRLRRARRRLIEMLKLPDAEGQM